MRLQTLRDSRTIRRHPDDVPILMSDSFFPVLELRDATCAAEGCALRGLSLSFGAGAFHLVTGEPAALRTALLRVLGLLDAPACGEVFFEGRNVASLAEPARDLIRNQRCGFLFAAPFLLSTFSVVENIAMPLFKISQVNPEQARERTDLLLEFTGLTAAAQMHADELTPYQQHAVSLARALANNPALITVESLDAGLATEDAARFAALLRQSCARFGVTIIASAPADFTTEPGDRILALDAHGAIPA